MRTRLLTTPCTGRQACHPAPKQLYSSTHLWGFLTPPVAGADLRAALVASCLRGALPPVDLRAVCFVRAMVSCWMYGCRRIAGAK